MNPTMIIICCSAALLAGLAFGYVIASSSKGYDKGYIVGFREGAQAATSQNAERARRESQVSTQVRDSMARRASGSIKPNPASRPAPRENREYGMEPDGLEIPVPDAPDDHVMSLGVPVMTMVALGVPAAAEPAEREPEQREPACEAPAPSYEPDRQEAVCTAPPSYDAPSYDSGSSPSNDSSPSGGGFDG